MAQRTRLPGVYFQVDPPPVADALPRMDIAAFVGFAASGPLDTPVPIEDIRRFRDIFGADVALAWDEEAGEVSRSCLGPAVEAFFRNGGRRCWVVRVAGVGVTNRFPVPGLLQLNRGASVATWRTVAVRARSQGAWSDRLTVGTALNIEALNVGTLRAQRGAGSSNVIVALTLDLSAAVGAVNAGDLLRLPSLSGERGLYLIAEQVTPVTQTIGGVVQLTQRVTTTQFLAYDKAMPTGLPPLPSAASVLTAGSEQALPAPSAFTVDAAGEYTVSLPLLLEAAPAVGSMVRLTFGARPLFLAVSRRELVQTQPADPIQTQLGGDAVRDALWPLLTLTTAELPATALTTGVNGLQVERLSLDLLTWTGQAPSARLRTVAFNAPGSRFWGTLPTDEALFQLPIPGQAPRTPGALDDEAGEPRFPLAAEPVLPASFILPLGMPLTPDRALAQGTLNPAPANSQLERDGLQTFSIDLFFDTRLRSAGVGGLLASAESLYYLRGLRLKGAHGLLPLEEITLLATPDGIHRGWRRAYEAGIGNITFLPAPALTLTLEDSDDPTEGRLIVLRWSDVAGATGYVLQEGADPDFRRQRVRYRGAERVTRLRVSDDADDCPDTRYFRVRAVRHAELGLWSETELVYVPEPDFLRCGFALLSAPALNPIPPALPTTDSYVLSWSAVPDATGYVAEEAGDTSFISAREIYRDAATTYTVRRRGDGAFYYRVRAIKHGPDGDILGPWSASQGIVIPPTYWVLNTPAIFDDTALRERFEELHQILLRFCAARADLFTVLALPAHYRENAAIAHANRLRSVFAGETRVLTYGAVYHPWVAFRLEDEADAQRRERLVFAPPDGAMTGQLAGTALERGAWIASANQPLRGVVALRPAIKRDDWLEVFNAQVNLVRPDPRGFVAMNADTLNTELEWTPMTVRRLLILLRRLALREGATYVFQPNNEFFRALVRNQFESLMLRLFQRGAFAGRQATESFQVFVGAAINTPAAIDRGQLFIELRVAPSRPMAFITVRLVQAGTDRLVVEEA